VEARRDFDSCCTRVIAPTTHYFYVAGIISRLVHILPEDGYEVELKLDKRGRVRAVIERWFEAGQVKEKKRRVKKLPW